ncbi:MAG: YebC/PmpR family DNA-binding transcriptional regulator [bacterium]|nr:YebC/PmpR family DNA-binding transcriptional regulator [bacterium]
MSGHSKWSTIKRKKGAIDEQRSKIFQKLAKELYVAAKNGDKDPALNANLRMVIEKAKAENMPKDKIENAINKASSKNDMENYDFVRYEGYGPGGVAIIVDCLTDNKNRTASFVRTALTKSGGNLGTSNSVAYLFERKGLLILDSCYEEDKLMEDVLDLDIIDFVKEEDGYSIECSYDNFIEIKDKLENLGYNKFITSEITLLPNSYISLDEEKQLKFLKLLEALENIDDVQNVYHNLDL